MCVCVGEGETKTKASTETAGWATKHDWLVLPATAGDAKLFHAKKLLRINQNEKAKEKLDSLIEHNTVTHRSPVMSPPRALQGLCKMAKDPIKIAKSLKVHTAAAGCRRTPRSTT